MGLRLRGVLRIRLLKIVFIIMLSTMGMSEVEGARVQIAAPFGDQWLSYKTRFLAADGRVVDTGNKHISHTEGQATGMLFALNANDRASFARIWDWTNGHLKRPDGLFSWRWDPARTDNPISDRNNATDGDLMLAWALLLAGESWGVGSYTAAAEEIIRSIEEHLVEPFGDRLVLRPGRAGFEGPGSRILNLSYCVFPALQEIAAHMQSEIWVDVYQDCLYFAQNAGFGRLSLPLDWIALKMDGDLDPAPKRPKRFGYDAIRVPLYLVWAGHDSPRFIERYKSAWQRYSREDSPPSWIDPFTGDHATYRAAQGFLAVRRLVDYALYRHEGARHRAERTRLPAVAKDDDYYSASLVMFSTLAVQSFSKKNW